MYLKSIKAHGFKSFADKIEINFNENINGIVGPNGSGKSNVVDAVRWVLGEQSIKSLRGDSSVDVIFSGSKSRKPLNSASVTLVFDNSDSYLPIDYNEVSIKRIMYRSGDNEYYINNERCRLKDINDLLTDSGAGRDSFNIISQGKIDEILSTKPIDRRTIFESAAGVLKYKKRKEEAIRKLDRTNQNLERVNDIINELDSNLIPLEKQSVDAKNYLNYKEQLENVEVALISHDITSLNSECIDIKEKLSSLNDELSLTGNSISSNDISILDKKDSLKKIEKDILDKQAYLLEVTKDIEKINSDIKILRERKKYIKGLNDVEDNVIDIKSKLLITNNNISALKNDLNIKINELNDINVRIKDYSSKYEDCKKRIDSINNSISVNNKDITNISYKIDYLENSIRDNNGLPNSIKKIFDNPRISNYHNVIGKLIDVPHEYSICINTCLGGSSNYLVVDTTNDAHEMVKYLKDNNLGRATFYPLDVIKGKFINDDILESISSIDGFIDIAINLVNYDNIYSNVISNRLGNIIVCRDLESGNVVSKIVNNKFKIVTLDGQEINVGGSITGGANIGNGIIRDKFELEGNKIKYEKLINKNKDLDNSLSDLRKEFDKLEDLIHKYRFEKNEYEESIGKLRDNITSCTNEKNDLERELNDIKSISNNKEDSEEEKLLDSYYSKINIKDSLVVDINDLNSKKSNISDELLELESLYKRSNSKVNSLEKEINSLNLKLNTNNIKIDNLLLSLNEEYNLTYDMAVNKYKLEIEVDTARNLVKDIKTNIKNIGYVNVNAIEEYENVKKRYDFLTGQRDDLHKAEDTLLEIINEMDTIMKDRFMNTFEQIRVEFKKVFKEMFRGGDAELILTDPDNILETGIDIEAVPSGKNLKSLSLLSGGEKTFTAISLLFAILNVRPVPFCLLDEVEAALDDANVNSFGNYLDKYKDKTQFILITHKKKTMEFANVLYGITMQESGVSKLVSVRLDDIEKEV